MTYPDSPINLRNNATLTSASQIALIWSPGSSDGGVPILSYDLIYDNGAANSVFISLKTGETGTTYTAVGMQVGKTYAFQIRT